MSYLCDSWQVHQSEVDNMRGKYFQMNGLIADPLQRHNKHMNCEFNSFALKKLLYDGVQCLFFFLLTVMSDS